MLQVAWVNKCYILLFWLQYQVFSVQRIVFLVSRNIVTVNTSFCYVLIKFFIELWIYNLFYSSKILEKKRWYGYFSEARKELAWRCSERKAFFKKFAKLTRKRLCQGLFFSKGVGLRNATLLKKRLQCGCFSVNFTKFFRTLFQRTPVVAASRSSRTK